MSYSVQQITGELKLNDIGSRVANSRFPRCDDWGKIDLLSYYYLKIDCLRNIDCQTPLSSTAEMELHRMCSMKEACTSSTFHSVDSVDPNSHKLVVHYRCLDHFVTFVDICTNTTKTDDKDMHLISSNSLRDSKRCQCSITGGGFSVLVNDVRLTSIASKSERICTPVILNIFSFKYECNSRKGVFNFQLGAASAVMANISLRSNARDILPEMIWITVQPKEIFTISCKSIAWETRDKPTTSGATSMSSTVSLNSTDSESTSGLTNWIYIVVGVVGSLVVLIIVTVAIYFCRKKRRKQPESKMKDTEMKKKKSEPGDNTKLITSTDNNPSAREKHYRKINRMATPAVKFNVGSESSETEFVSDHSKFMEGAMLQ